MKRILVLAAALAAAGPAFAQTSSVSAGNGSVSGNTETPGVPPGVPNVQVQAGGGQVSGSTSFGPPQQNSRQNGPQNGPQNYRDSRAQSWSSNGNCTRQVIVTSGNGASVSTASSSSSNGTSVMVGDAGPGGHSYVVNCGGNQDPRDYNPMNRWNNGQ